MFCIHLQLVTMEHTETSVLGNVANVWVMYRVKLIQDYARVESVMQDIPVIFAKKVDLPVFFCHLSAIENIFFFHSNAFLNI